MAAFWNRANTWFESRGITVQRILTDNGNGYRSRAFADAHGPRIKHKRTRPYRPQTNGKVERFNRTMLDERAYAAPTLQKRTVSPRFRPGCIITITEAIEAIEAIEATPHSKVSHQPAASPNSQAIHLDATPLHRPVD